MLNICCLCPTYGRPTLVQNAISMFQAQHYPKDKCRLLILDDGDQITGGGDNWTVITQQERAPSYCAKYGQLSELATQVFQPWIPDAFALFEDDDIYGPFYLLAHNHALKNHPWSYPREIHSLYGVDTRKGQKPITEPSAGRFWSSSAIRLDYLFRLGGFITSGRADADQLNLNHWSRSIPGDPNEYHGIQWIYGWGRAFHCSGLMTQGPADTEWYHKHRKTETHRVDQIQPRMDSQTAWLYRELWCKGCDPTACTCGRS